ncbi:MAG: hypothetical protein ACYTKD_20655 [Planctomycetota bacterium]|jgi:hypothetical protein
MSSSPEFKWEHYLDLAEQLADSQEAGEPKLRSAISRAYYAAFHVAMQLLRDNQEYTPTLSGKDHGNVWRRYKTGPGTGIERKQIGNRGFQLLRDREQADYRVPLACSKGSAWKTAEFALLNARYIVASVNGIRTRQQAKQRPQGSDSTATGPDGAGAGPEETV